MGPLALVLLAALVLVLATRRPSAPWPPVHGTPCSYLITGGALCCSGCCRPLGVTVDEAISRTYIICHRCNTIALDRRPA